MNKTFRLFILYAICALLAIGGYVYGTRYISSLAEKTIAIKKEAELSEIRYRNLQSLEKAAVDSGDQKLQIDNLLIRPGAAIKFVTEVEDLASAQNLIYNTDAIDVRSVSELDMQNKELLLVSFSANGSWSNVFRFIKLIETLPYTIQFEKISLNMTGTSPVVTEISTGTSTSVVQPRGERNWKVTLVFTVVKVKDN